MCCYVDFLFYNLYYILYLNMKIKTTAIHNKLVAKAFKRVKYGGAAFLLLVGVAFLGNNLKEGV